ncbi:MAG TPA: hypothetical protein VGG63_07995 [Steroidobacteraceae bacterium]
MRLIVMFGPRIVVLELLSRRFGWTAVHGRIRAIDTIIDRNLK